MARRFDTVELAAKGLQRTPSGGASLPAALTRVGVFEYRTNTGGTIREYRPAAEVFNVDSLASLQGAPVTELHPAQPVTPDNWRTVSRGHVAEGSVAQDADHVVARLAVEDSGTVAKIARGELVEISCGYECDIDATPGVDPTGAPYDQSQRGIRYNHVALGPGGWGRAGASVCLRLDSAGNQQTQPTERKARTQPMKFPRIEKVGPYLRVDGAKYDLRTVAGRAGAKVANELALLGLKHERTDSATADAVETMNAALAGAVDAFKVLAASLTDETPAPAEEKPKADAPPETTEDADEEKKTDEGDEEKKDADEETAKKMDARADARALLIVKAQSFKPGITTTGRSDADVMREALTHAKVRCDGMSTAEIRGAFMATAPRKAHPSLATLAAATNESARTDGEDADAVTPGEHMHRTARDAWRTKKPASK